MGKTTIKLRTHRIKDQIPSGYDNIKNMTHRMRERNRKRQDKIKRRWQKTSLLYRILQLHSDCFLNSMCLTLYAIMSTWDVFFYPRCPMFYENTYDKRTHYKWTCRYKAYYNMRQVLPVVPAKQSYRFGMLSPIRCIICSTLSGQPVMCSFVLCVSCFTLSCPLALLFHPIC
jgi:hypothetical protein